MESKMKLPFAVLCAVPFIMVLGNSMLIPLLPVMRAEMSLTQLQESLIITAFSIPAGLTIPIAGIFSDRFGRKTIMAPALIVYGIGGLIAGAAAFFLDQPYILLIAGRIVQGIGAGGTYQLAMALTGDIFQTSERTKALGLLEAFNGAGKVISPVAGSALGLVIWFAPFFAYGLLSIPVGIAVWLLVKESKKKQPMAIKQYTKQVGQVFSEKLGPLLASFLAGMAVLFILFGVLSYVSDILEKEYQIKGFMAGLLIAIPVSAMALTSYLAGTYLGKVGNLMQEVVVSGSAAVAVSLMLISFFTNLYFFFLILVLTGVGTGLVLPAVNTLVTSAASSEKRGFITCLYGSVRFFGVALGPPAFGLMSNWGHRPMFWSAASLMAVVAVVALIFIKEKILLPKQLLPSS